VDPVDHLHDDDVPSGAYVGGLTYSVAASASSGLAVAISRPAASLRSVLGSTVAGSSDGSGTCVVRANCVRERASYGPASQVQQSFTVVLAVSRLGAD
jgi:hypothetical protein